jgi:translation elongation factor EF-Tu-like GTPase
MYDKKGNLTAIGKKVMNHGKKPGDKGYVESIDEMFPAVAAIAGRAVAGAAARAIAKKKKDEASEYEKTRRKTIKSVESFKQFREEGGAGEEGTDELVKNFKKDTPNA